MPLTKRTLEKWRSESLSVISQIQENKQVVDRLELTKELHERILKLTQELLDQQLMRRM